MPWGPIDPRRGSGPAGKPDPAALPRSRHRLRPPQRALPAGRAARRPAGAPSPCSSRTRARAPGTRRPDLGARARSAARPERARDPHPAAPDLARAPARRPPPRPTRASPPCPARGSRCSPAATAGTSGSARRTSPASPGSCARLAEAGAGADDHALPPHAAGPAPRRSPTSPARRGFLWDGTGENPYVPMLALADAVVVTADSVNMVGEAAATGAPILVFEPSGGHPKLAPLPRRPAAPRSCAPFRRAS